MPLPAAAPRSDIHHRVIDMRAYRREDGLYDVEAHLVDTKPFDLVRFGGISVVSAGNEPVSYTHLTLPTSDLV